MLSAPAANAVPVPPSRPVEAGSPQAPERSGSDDPACARVISAGRIIVSRHAPIAGEGGCGVTAPVRLESIVLRDGTHVSVEPQALMRCDLAEALGDWIREDIEPLAQQAGGGLAKVMGADSYVCRGRNRVAGAKMSEHGRGNAFDVMGFSLRNGSMISVGTGNGAGAFVSGLRSSGCARFTTVLGPGSDGFHETHMHVDLAVRSGGHRICQWELKQR